MKKEYVEHYVTQAFGQWFSKINSTMGDVPFRAVVQNFLYYQDANNPEYVRLQSFVNGIVKLVEQLNALPDPEEPPKLVRLTVYPDIPKIGGPKAVILSPVETELAGLVQCTTLANLPKQETT